MSDENVTKRNGLGVDPMQRLASFKPPRDLSLGASKPTKKVFTPNLNVARNKNKGSSSNTREKRDEKTKRERKNDRNNRNFKNGPNIVKSGGVFSEGLGSAERHYDRSSYGRDKDSAPTTIQKPTIRVKDVIKIDKELEAQKINSLLCGQDDGVGAEAEDYLRSDDPDAPVTLPMDIGCYRVESKPKVQVKKEFIVKTEPPDVDSTIPMVAALDVAPDVDTKLESYEDLALVNLLTSAQPTLMLIKLPDSLPGRGVEEETPRRKPTSQQPHASTDTDEQKERNNEHKVSDSLPGRGVEEETPRRKPTSQQPHASTDTDEQKERNNEHKESRCQLKDLEEGRIGTLQIHRSGQVTIKLGHTSFEVVAGTKSAFHQQVVSVAADPTSRSARIVSLGALTHKLCVVPHWGHMLNTQQHTTTL